MPRRAISATAGRMKASIAGAGSKSRHRGDCAHAAGVRPGVAVAHPLVVARRAQEHGVGAVAQANRLHSQPVKHSSMTTERPASPKAWPSMMRAMAASASSTVAATTTPLPEARPSAFTTMGAPRRRTKSRAAAGSSKRSHRAVGMPAASHSSLVKALLPSNCAAARLGPQQRMPAAAIASASPATRGPSGPGTTRSTALPRANSTSPCRSMACRLTFSATCAVPGLPGATHSLVSSGEADSAQASACSRPPDPTINTRIPPLRFNPAPA